MFIHRNQRINFKRIVQPPYGFKTERVIACTYQLDLTVLLPVIIHSCLFNQNNIYFNDNTLASLIEIAKSTVRIYCHKSRINVPKELSKLYGLFEDCISEVQQSSAFIHLHPKMILVRFVSNYQPPIYRLALLSRNLTMELNWFNMLLIEGSVGNKLQHNGNALADLIQILANSEDFVESNQFINDLRKVEFIPPHPFEEMVFFPFGFNDYENPLNNRSFENLIMIAPLMSNQLLSEFLQQVSGRKTIFTRRSTLAKLDDSILEKANCYELSPFPPTSKYRTSMISYLDEREPQGHHMKIYIGSTDSKRQILLGSANLTEGAFTRNIEFLVELTAYNSAIMPATFIQELLAPDTETDNFIPYNRQPQLDLSARLDSINELRKLEYLLLNSESTAIYLDYNFTQNDQSLDSNLVIDLRMIMWDGAFNVTVSLLCQPDTVMKLTPGRINQFLFKSILSDLINSYIIFTIEHAFIKSSKFMTKVESKLIRRYC